MRAISTLAILAISASLFAEPMRGGMVGMPVTDSAILSVANAYVAAVLAGDARAAVAAYREDAVEMVPGLPPIRGRASIEQYYRGMLGGPVRVTGFTLEHGETTVAGDVAFDAGTYRRTGTCPAGSGTAPFEDTGKYVVILKRTAGAWKIAYTIFNSDSAVQPPPAR